MRLTPIDHIFFGKEAYSIQFFFKYEKLPTVDKLQVSLDKALEKFEILKKRLTLKEDTFYLEKQHSIHIESIDCAEKYFPDIGDTASLKDHNLVVNALENTPLMRVQVSRFKDADGLTLNISHCLVDGFSFFMFLSYWANVHRDLTETGNVKPETLLFSPDFDRSLLCPDLNIQNIDDFEIEAGGLAIEGRRNFGEV